MTATKNEVYIGLYYENYYLVRGDKNLVGAFLQVRWIGTFWPSGRTPPIPLVRKTLVSGTEINKSHFENA